MPHDDFQKQVLHPVWMSGVHWYSLVFPVQNLKLNIEGLTNFGIYLSIRNLKIKTLEEHSEIPAIETTLLI